MSQIGHPSAFQNERIVLFIADAACARVSQGNATFRSEAARELARHLTAVVERLLVYLSAKTPEDMPLRCGFHVIKGDAHAHGPSNTRIQLSFPSARLVETFGTEFREAALHYDAENSTAPSANHWSLIGEAIETALGYSSEGTFSRPARPLVFLFSRIPATFPEIRSYLSLNVDTMNETVESSSEVLQSTRNSTRGMDRRAVANALRTLEQSDFDEGHSASDRLDTSITAVKAALNSVSEMRGTFCAIEKHRLLFRWIDSGSRRADRHTSFDLRAFGLVQEWLSEQDLNLKTTYMYSLLSERAVVPFTALAESLDLESAPSSNGNDDPHDPAHSCNNSRVALVQCGDSLLFETSITPDTYFAKLFSSNGLPQRAIAVNEATRKPIQDIVLVSQCTMPAIDLSATGWIHEKLDTSVCCSIRPTGSHVPSWVKRDIAQQSKNLYTDSAHMDSKSYNTCSFAGIMVYLAHTQSVLIADIYVCDLRGKMAPLQGYSCAVSPVTPLSGQLRLLKRNRELPPFFKESKSLPREVGLWPRGDTGHAAHPDLHNGEKQSACDRRERARCIAQSARCFETFIGASTSCMTVPEFLEEPVDETLARSLANVALRTKHTCIAALFETWAAEADSPTGNGLEENSDIQNALNTMNDNTTLAKYVCDSAVSDRERLLSILQCPRNRESCKTNLSETIRLGKQNGQKNHIPNMHRATQFCNEAVAERTTLPPTNAGIRCIDELEASDVPIVSLNDCRNSAVLNHDLADKVVRSNGARPDKTLYCAMTNVYDGIEKTETSNEAVSKTEIVALFHCLKALITYADGGSRKIGEAKSFLQSPKQTCDRIAFAREQLFSSDIDVTHTKSLSKLRTAMASLVRAYAQVTLILVKQTRSLLKKTDSSQNVAVSLKRYLKHILQILASVQLEGQSIGKHLEPASLLDDLFDSFFEIVLAPQPSHPVLCRMICEIRRLHDRTSEFCAKERVQSQIVDSVSLSPKRSLRASRGSLSGKKRKGTDFVSETGVRLMRPEIHRNSELDQEFSRQQPLRLRRRVSESPICRSATDFSQGLSDIVRMPSSELSQSQDVARSDMLDDNNACNGMIRTSTTDNMVILAPATPRKARILCMSNSPSQNGAASLDSTLGSSGTRDDDDDDDDDEVVGTP